MLSVRKGNHPDLRQIGIHPDYWYPMAQSKDLPKNKTLGVVFAGDAIVVARTASGGLFALEDRCAHRQFPLHLGVVEGEGLQCGYHSWTYDPNGNLKGIPYLPKAQQVPMRIRSYPCREAYGLIFIFAGDLKTARTTPLPEIPTWVSPRHKTMYFFRKVNCHYTFMHENLLDMNHQFLHRRLMGNIRASLLETRKGADWIEIDYKFESVGGKRHFGAEFMLGPKDADPDKRNYDIMSIRTQYPYQTLTVRRPSGTEPAFYLWAAYVPVDKEQRTNNTFGLLMIRKPGIPGLINLFWPAMRYFTGQIFAEDRLAVEEEQNAYNKQGGDWNNEVYPAILDLRKILLQKGVPLSQEQPALNKEEELPPKLSAVLTN